MTRFMLLPRTGKGTLRLVLPSPRLQWYLRPRTVRPMLMSGTAHRRRRTKLKPVSARDIPFPCRRIHLGRVAPMFHHQTGRAGTVTNLVIGQTDVPILPRTLKETSVRGVFTILQWRKFLLVKWSPLVSFLLMITLQLCSLIRVLHIPL